MKFNSIVFIWLVTCLFTGCEKEELVTPSACFTLSSATAGIFETITVTNCSSKADFYTLWKGNEGNNYETYISEEYKNREKAKDFESGVSMLFEGETTIFYTKPGNYKIYLIARSISKWNAAEMKEDITFLEVTIE